MKRLYRTVAALAAALVIANVARPLPAAAPGWPNAPARAPREGLAVMTFNVKGLPYPLASGRPQALVRIGRSLAALRRRGAQPDVVLLQEAFTNEAKAIAREAGYAFIATGPDIPPGTGTDPGSNPMRSPIWYKGEGLGKWIDSGLVILSDYPIVRRRTLVFPGSMCAGFDCLAAKGVQIAWIAVPGTPRPVAIANTHLNARKASGVAQGRADAAYRRQVAATRRFLAASVSPATDLILGGDFNIGHDPGRLAATRAGGGLVPTAREATRALDCHACTPVLQDDLAAIRRRDKDKQFFRPGAGETLQLSALEVPFGLTNGAAALSDHIGYVAHYRFYGS